MAGKRKLGKGLIKRRGKGDLSVKININHHRREGGKGCDVPVNGPEEGRQPDAETEKGKTPLESLSTYRKGGTDWGEQPDQRRRVPDVGSVMGTRGGGVFFPRLVKFSAPKGKR